MPGVEDGATLRTALAEIADDFSFSWTPGARALFAELARLGSLSKGKRVLVEELFRGAGRFEPGLVGDPEARSRFRNALNELQAAGRITLPAAHSPTGWDARVLPPIPVF